MKVKYLILSVLFLFGSEILTLLTLNVMVMFFIGDIIGERIS